MQGSRARKKCLENKASCGKNKAIVFLNIFRPYFTSEFDSYMNKSLLITRTVDTAKVKQCTLDFFLKTILLWATVKYIESCILASTIVIKFNH